LRGFRKDFAFRQNPAPYADDSVGPDHVGPRKFRAGRCHSRRHASLFLRKARGEAAGKFVLSGCFIDVGWQKRIRLNPDLLQKLQAARRRRRQDELRTPGYILAG
jgi:hypothetical protein